MLEILGAQYIYFTSAGLVNSKIHYLMVSRLAHGVLAPNAKLRREVVPSPPEQATAPACDHAQGAPARLSWARLLKRVFDIDIEHCPNCGGSLKSIAAPSTRLRTGIEDPPVIVKILAHLGLPTRAPPRSPAQRFDLFQT